MVTPMSDTTELPKADVLATYEKLTVTLNGCRTHSDVKDPPYQPYDPYGPGEAEIVVEIPSAPSA
jgi:hypothetical protein